MGLGECCHETFCKRVGGYENPAISAWATSTTLQAIVAMALLLLANTTGLDGSLTEALNTDQYGLVMFVTRGTFLGLGILHTVLFLASCLLSIAGYFFWVQFLCFSCPLMLVNIVACLVTAAFGGYMLSWAYDVRVHDVESMREIITATMETDFSTTFVNTNAAVILLVAVASLTCVIPLMRSATIDRSGTMVDVMLNLPIVTGCMAVAGILIFPSREKVVLLVGGIWFAAAVLASIFVALQKAGGLTTRLSTIILCAFYAVVFVLAGACVIAFGRWFVLGRTQSIRVLRAGTDLFNTTVKNMSDTEYWYFKNFEVMNEGSFILAAATISAMMVIYSFMGAAFCLRATFGASSALARSASGGSSKS